MNNDDRIRQRLAKLLALAQRGVGGEKDNAARMLDKLLAKRGLTMADITDEAQERTRVRFRFKGKDESMLLFQVVASVRNQSSLDVWRPKRGAWCEYELTRAEAAEVAVRFDAYRRAMAKEIEKARRLAVQAFIQVNRIFSESTGESGQDNKPLTPERLREIEEILSAMRKMKRIEIHKQLQHGAIDAPANTR